MGSGAIELYRQIPNSLYDEISHICVLNACSHSGILQQAHNIFNEITLKTEKVDFSWTDANDEVVGFTVDDHSYPQSKGIHAAADLIKSELIENGYKCDSSWLTRELDEKETIESALCDEAIKRIAKIRQREIIVRNANRLHHFYKNGQSSCQDHF
ncbi:unnamed protein product [Rotaria sp. Silwood1]|nr:unnamed protein product [Rotaria sp. Silwood1]